MSFVIAIDGTFASGKGTLAKKLAEHYNLSYLDTGKLYRAVGHAVLKEGGNPDVERDAVKAVQSLNITALGDPILKSADVAVAASKVAIHKNVRAALLEFQRDFAKNGAVLDGRDIGTVICPEAPVKFYIDADPEERARRRHLELIGYGEDINFETVLAQLEERDNRDKSRAQAPLKAAPDAHFIDTTKLSIQDVLNVAIKVTDIIFDSN